MIETAAQAAASGFDPWRRRHSTADRRRACCARRAKRTGLHVATLAAALKVPVHKLEALEADDIDALPDAVFARALAASVCRSLKIDPAPVLAKSARRQQPAACAEPTAASMRPFRSATRHRGAELARHAATRPVFDRGCGAAARRAAWSRCCRRAIRKCRSLPAASPSAGRSDDGHRPVAAPTPPPAPVASARLPRLLPQPWSSRRRRAAAAPWPPRRRLLQQPAGVRRALLRQRHRGRSRRTAIRGSR